MADTDLADESPTEDAPLLSDKSQATADSSPATDTATESPADDASKQPRDEDGKFLSEKAQKRIDHLTWESKQAQREAEYWRQRAMETARPAEPPKPAEPAPTLPTLEAYGYDEAKYQAALVDFARAEARRETEAILTRREQEAQERAKAATFEKRQAEFIASKPDYADKVLRDPTLPISEVMADVIRESDDGPALAYYLAENRAIAETIAQLPERAAARELGRLEQRLASQREAAKASSPPVSKAPPPPPRIEAVSETTTVRTTDSSGDRLSDDEWVRLERKRLARKGK